MRLYQPRVHCFYNTSETRWKYSLKAGGRVPLSVLSHTVTPRVLAGRIMLIGVLEESTSATAITSV